MTRIHRWCHAVRTMVNRTETGLDFFLDKIEAAHQCGFSPETMPMIDMESAAKTLRKLADRIDAERRKLIAHPRLEAAE